MLDVKTDYDILLWDALKIKTKSLSMEMMWSSFRATYRTKLHSIAEQMVHIPKMGWPTKREMMVSQELHAQAYFHYTRIHTTLWVKQNVGPHKRCNEVKNSGSSWESQAPSCTKGWGGYHTLIIYKYKQSLISRNRDAASRSAEGPSVLWSELQRVPEARPYLYLPPNEGQISEHSFPGDMSGTTPHILQSTNIEKTIPWDGRGSSMPSFKTMPLVLQRALVEKNLACNALMHRHAFITDNATSCATYKT